MLVVEDEPLMASLLADCLTEGGFEVQVAVDAAQARIVAEDFDPDVAVLDIGLGDGPSGVHLAYALRKSSPGIAIVMLTQHADPLRASGGLDLPAGVGYLRKHDVGDVTAVHTVVERVIADGAGIQPQAKDGHVTQLSLSLPLSEQPMRVLELLAKGYDNAAIAERMGLSMKSAERWVAYIYEELRIPTRGEVNPRVEAARRFIAVQGLPERQP